MRGSPEADAERLAHYPRVSRIGLASFGSMPDWLRRSEEWGLACGASRSGRLRESFPSPEGLRPAGLHYFREFLLSLCLVPPMSCIDRFGFGCLAVRSGLGRRKKRRVF